MNAEVLREEAPRGSEPLLKHDSNRYVRVGVRVRVRVGVRVWVVVRFGVILRSGAGLVSYRGTYFQKLLPVHRHTSNTRMSHH